MSNAHTPRDPGTSASASMIRRVALVTMLVGMVAVPAYFQNQRFAARDARSAPLKERSDELLDEFRALTEDPVQRQEFERLLLAAMARKAHLLGANPVTDADVQAAIDEFAASLEDSGERKGIARRLLAALRQRKQAADSARADAIGSGPESLRHALSELAVRAEQDQ